MDGYTVDEAAEVLGIPGKRVWELITTGVLAASSEGRSGMRVFLQPRTTTDMESVAGGEPRGSEATPFRELLTEFRNLTERYGQALLALGEARGEVASLRGRVELLEARMDVPHAPARIAPVGSWPSAETLVRDEDEDEASLDEMAGLAPPAAEQEIGREETPAEEASAERSPGVEQILEPEVEVGADAVVNGGVTEETLAAPPPEETDGRARRRGRSRAAHPNLADIPAALARAEDPSAAELRSALADRAAVAEPDGQAVVPAQPEEIAPEAVKAPPDEEQVVDAEAPLSDDAGGVLEDETSEPDAPLYDAASPYNTAFDEPDWIIEEDLWRSVSQAGDPDAVAAPLPATDGPPEAEIAEPEPEEPFWVSTGELHAAAEPATAETDGTAEPSVSIEAKADEPEPASAAIEEVPADVAFSIGEAEPGEQHLAEGAEEDAEPPGDFDAFMAAADLGSSSGSEPDYAAELEHSTAGWHSAIAPTGEIVDAEDAAPAVESEEAAPPADETAATATTDQSDDSITDSWDASEMEAIRALLARANAIDREQLEVEASSHPLEPDQEESVREIVASGAGDEPAMPEPPDAAELIADLGSPDAGRDEPPLSLASHLELPGSDDLGEAMAALEAIASGETPQSDPPDPAASSRSAALWPEAERRAWPGAAAAPSTTPVPTIEPATAGSPGEEVVAHLDFGAPSSYDPAPVTPERSDSAAASLDEGADAAWSESRESAAGRAFRRLRRIFPG